MSVPSVHNIMGLFEDLRGIGLGVHQSRCSVVRNRNVDCLRCAMMCTSGCISVAGNELKIDPSKCIGCGTCATACPTGALVPKEPTDVELMESCSQVLQKTGGELVVACEQMLKAAEGLYDPDRVVSLKCLGRMDESLLVALVAEGAARIVMVQGPCSECAYVRGLIVAKGVAQSASDLLQAWGSEASVSVREKLPRSVRKTDVGYDVGKRRMFFSTKDTAKSASLVAADYMVREALDIDRPEEPRFQKVGEDGALPHFMPPRRQLLLDSLDRLGQPDDVLVQSRLWGHVVIDEEACTSCRLCSVFCPTAAITRFDDEDGTVGIEHMVRVCLKCRCCEESCLHQALTLSDEVFVADVASGAAERHEMEPQKPMGFFGTAPKRKK